MKEKNSKAVKAGRGDRTIKMIIYFRTDGIEGLPVGQIKPKHAWDCGIVEILANRAHGLSGASGVKMTFNSMAELPATVQRALLKNDVKLHHLHKARRLYAAESVSR